MKLFDPLISSPASVPVRIQRTVICLLLAVVVVPVWAMSGDGQAAASASADMKAAMHWLAPAWSPAQQAASVGKPNGTTLLHVPGSKRSYTRAQLVDTSRAPDWWPQDHPPMPHIVEYAAGKAMPCALCHLPNGAGEPQNASLAGLSVAYITEQLKAFRTGARSNSHVMHMEATNMTPADVRSAATYYAGLVMPAGRIHVIETGRVPAMHTDYWMLVPAQGAGSQSLGNRLIETPGDVEQMELRNARSGYVAFVPNGSVARGKALAAGDGRRAACASCHGARLRGGENAPALAGRSPTTIARQLVQFELGGRRGPQSEPMQKVVSDLTLNDMISVAAYAATLKP